MATEHKNIVEAQLHELKGASTGKIYQVPVSNGSGSTAFKYQTAILNVRIDDVSTAKSIWVVSPIAGEIEKMYSVIDGAIATADAVMSLKIATVTVTGSTLTIAYSGSAAGDVDNCTPSALKTIAAGANIEIVNVGDSVNTIPAWLTIVIRGNAS